MILFTGGGAFYEAFKKTAPCEYVSLRRSAHPVIKEAIENASVIINNAASIQCQNVEEAIRDNFMSTFWIVNLCLRLNPKVKFIYLGSMSFYESENRVMPVEEMTPYAYSKYLGETFCLKSSLPNVCSACFSTLFYGNPEKDGLSKLLTNAATENAITIYDGGVARRDFIPIEIAALYVARLVRHKFERKVYTIASGQSTSFGDVARYLKVKFPSLQVNDLPLENKGKEVLSDFSKKSIQELGEIPFSLQEEMEKYLDSHQVAA